MKLVPSCTNVQSYNLGAQWKYVQQVIHVNVHSGFIASYTHDQGEMSRTKSLQLCVCVCVCNW